MSKWNGKRFSVYTSDEKSALGLINQLGEQTNYNTDEVERLTESDNKKVSHDEMKEKYKLDENANFTGSWFGLKKPTESSVGLQATVDKINDEELPNMKKQINVNKDDINNIFNNMATTDDIARLTTATPIFVSSVGEMSDATKVYVNTTDKFIYTYKNGSFQSTNIQYLANELNDNSLTSKKVVSLERHYKELVPFYAQNNKYYSNGTYTTYAKLHCYEYAVKEGQTIRVKSVYKEAVKCINFVDIDNNTLEGYVNSHGTDVSFDNEYIVPKNCTKMIINKNTDTTIFEVYQVKIGSTIGNEIINISSFNENLLSDTLISPIETKKATYIKGSLYNISSYDSYAIIDADIYSVNEGDKITVNCGIIDTCYLVTVLDSEERILLQKQQGNASNFVEYSLNITIPPNGKKLVVNRHNQLNKNYSVKKKVIKTNLLENKLSDKYFLFCGDSIIQAVNGSGGWATRVKNKYGATVENIGIGGATLQLYAERPYSVYEKIKGYTNKDKVTHTIFDGGTNDIWIGLPLGTITNGYDDEINLNTFCGALEGIFRELQNNYPKTKIGYIIVHKVNISTIAKQEEYYSKAREICKKYSVKYLDLFNTSNINCKLSSHLTRYFHESDGIHFNDYGYDYTQTQVEKFIESL